jgi:predicted outer membrane repeat protein
VAVRDSTVCGNTAGWLGGGIFSDAYGTLTVSNSTLSGNFAQNGGGIANFGTLTVRDSTIAGNTPPP